MISMYTGSVGSGKSFHALDVGLKIIKEKRYGQYRHVIANYPLIPAEEKWYWKFLPKKVRQRKIEEMEAMDERWIFRDEISVEYLIAESIKRGWYGKESMCMVEIDEAGIIFNSRDWNSKAHDRTKWIKFLALSRKFGYDFIFVAQADRMIDKQIRGLCEYEVKHLKANNSFFMSFLNIFKITLFMYVYQWYVTKMRGDLRFGRFKAKIADRYDTMRVFDFDYLIKSIRGLYEGKIIPAPVALQLSLWEKEKLDRAYELAMQEKAENEANKSFYEDLDEEGKKVYGAYLSQMNEVLENEKISNKVS
ncbi:MAG: zonular occludens toxin domain-containing protein [Bacilli bacterium]